MPFKLLANQKHEDCIEFGDVLIKPSYKEQLCILTCAHKYEHIIEHDVNGISAQRSLIVGLLFQTARLWRASISDGRDHPSC